ncbi:MAG: ArnT family glycosyltransferase [Planctomycetaceae bacterium]
MPDDHPPPSPDHDSRDAIRLVLAFLAVRCAAAWFCPATIDEAYGIVVSRAWSLSYFDHPPACFTLARVVAWLTGSESVFLARVPFLLAGTAAAWLVYDVTRIAYGPVAGLWALAWHSVAPFFLVSAGHFVVPDGPLDLALLLTLRLVLPDLLAPDRAPHLGRWCAAGAAFAVAFASKYQAVLFGASALAVLVASPPHRRLLRSPAVWAALAISAVGLLPTLLWNQAHGWISLGFQAGRAGAGSLSLQPVNFLLVLGGQMLYVLPGTWLVTLVAGFRGVTRPRTPADRVFGWFAILPPVVFLAIALVSRRSLPHWAMSGFLFGFPLVGEWTARALERHRRAIELTWRWTAAAVVIAFLGYSMQARHAAFTRAVPALAATCDLDWQHQDWPALADARAALGAPDVIVTSNWTTAAKAAHALGPTVAVVPASDPRHFQFLPRPALDHVAFAVAPADPGAADRVREDFTSLLGQLGWRVVGTPRVIDQRTGGQLRFHLVAIPVRPADANR